MSKKRNPCEWVGLEKARQSLGVAENGNRGKALDLARWYVACRLVVEGGFHPDLITPRPPFVVENDAGRCVLHHDASAARPGKATVLGGLKTQDVDVAVSIADVGPCLAISVKSYVGVSGTLTDRLEKIVGNCANIHMGYPLLVYGLLVLIGGNRREFVGPFHYAMSLLTGRPDLRRDPDRYEGVGILSLAPDDETRVQTGSAKVERSFNVDAFFASLYQSYDRRYVSLADKLRPLTRRLVWDRESPAVRDPRAVGMTPRISAGTVRDEFM